MDRKIEKKSWSIKKIGYLASAFIILILVTWQIFFADQRSKYRVDKNQITIKTVKNGLFRDFISVSGEITSARTVYLDAIEGGRVEELFVEEGAIVRKNDPVLRLSNTDLHLSIMNREAQLAEQMNLLRSTRLQMEQNSLNLKRDILAVNFELTKTKREFNNYKKLYTKNFISKEEFLNYKEKYELLEKEKKLTVESQKQDSLFRAVQVKQLEDSVNMLKNNLQYVRQRIENLVVNAPIDGQLASLNAEVGESINKGERLGEISIMNSFKISSEINEYYINRIQKNLKGTIDYQEQTINLVINKIYPQVENGNFQVDFKFVGDYPKNLRIGQSFRIKVELGKPKTTLMIPRGSFYQSTGGQWIYVLNNDQTQAEKRPIQIGKQNPKFYEIVSGLDAGEKVITNNYDIFGNAEVIIIRKEK